MSDKSGLSLTDSEFMIHSLILTLDSPAFEKMLSSSMQEGSAGEVRLPGDSLSKLQMSHNYLQLLSMEDLSPASAIFLSR